MKNYYFSTKKMCVGYDGKPLIKDIEINLPRGEILTLIGPNGAGKSTVLKSIAGQLRLLGGKVYLEQSGRNESGRTGKKNVSGIYREAKGRNEKLPGRGGNGKIPIYRLVWRTVKGG